MRPTRAAARRLARHLRIFSGMPAAPTWSCSRWGFPCRRRRRRRGALLPHRFTLAARAVSRNGPAVYFLWHFPWGRPRRALPGTAPPWSPDFPLPATGGERPSGRLASGDLVTRATPVKGPESKPRRYYSRQVPGWPIKTHEDESRAAQAGSSRASESADQDCAGRAGSYNRRKSSQTTERGEEPRCR